MDSETVQHLLQRIPWFHELPSHQLEELVLISKMQELEDGEVLFREGDSENSLYILIEGQILMDSQVPGHGRVLVYTADPLDIVGWDVMTPVVRQRTGTATACGKCRLISIDSPLLRQMCENEPEFGFVIMRRLANTVASRLLSTRLRLYDLLHQPVAR